MSSSAEDAIPLLKTWMEGNKPVVFDLTIDSLIAAKGKVSISRDTDERAIVLEGAADLRLAFLLDKATRSELRFLPTGLAEVVIIFPRVRLSLAVVTA